MKEEAKVIDNVTPIEESQNSQERRPYIPPTLTVFGDVEDLTRSAGNLGSDGVFTSRTAA